MKRTDGKYRFAIKAAITDLCRGDDGRTVQAGAKRTTEFQLQPFVDSKTGKMILAATGSLRLNPNRRGDSVGCRDTTSEIDVQAEKLTKATRGTVKQRLSPIPQPDLVPRPDFAVSVKGVRMVYYPVKGRARRSSTSDGRRRRRRTSTAARSSTAGTPAAADLVLHQVVDGPRLLLLRRSVHRQLHVTGTDQSRMSMPIARWTGPSLVPRGLVRWWKATQRYVRDHEAGHVAISREWERKLRSRVVGADCSEANAIIKKWSNQRNAAQEAYDRREYSRTDWPEYPSEAR